MNTTNHLEKHSEHKEYFLKQKSIAGNPQNSLLCLLMVFHDSKNSYGLGYAFKFSETKNFFQILSKKFFLWLCVLNFFFTEI